MGISDPSYCDCKQVCVARYANNYNYRMTMTQNTQHQLIMSTSIDHHVLYNYIVEGKSATLFTCKISLLLFNEILLSDTKRLFYFHCHYYTKS